MRIVHFETIDSTNTYLKDRYQTLDDLCFVFADTQSQGRGRNGRFWQSHKGNLMFSLLLKDERYLRIYDSLTLIPALAIVKVLEGYGLRPMIKWPNDVYVDDRKICGILAESVSREKMECLIIGTGFNVNEEGFTGDFVHEPTSMKIECGHDIDLADLRQRVVESYLEYLDKAVQGTDFHDEISQYDYLAGRRVYAQIDGEKKEVRVVRIG